MTVTINHQTYGHATINLHVGGERIDVPLAGLSYTEADEARAQAAFARAVLGHGSWATAAPLCWKCRGGRARAHHRRCPKRGAGHRGHGEELRRLQGMLLQLGLRARIGRYVDGFSLPEARRRARDACRIGSLGTRADILEVVRRVARCAADVSSPMPGVIAVRLARGRPAWMLAKVHEALRERASIGMQMTVEPASDNA